MLEINLVLTDIDGTLVQPEAQFASKEVISSLREAELRGIKFAAVTGRPFRMAKDLMKTIGFHDPCVFDGGATIINPETEEVLWAKTIPAETTKYIVEKLGKYAFKIDFGNGMVNPDDINISEISKPTLSIWASVLAEHANDIIESFGNLPGVAIHANVGPGGDYKLTGIQATHIEADKEHAVNELLSLIGIDRQHTLAIGDGDNDLPLFNVAKVKVAMGNSSEILKAKSNHIVASVYDDGFAEAIRSFT